MSFVSAIFFQALSLLFPCQEVFSQRAGIIITQCGKRIRRRCQYATCHLISKKIYGETGVKVHQYRKVMEYITAKTLRALSA